MNLREFHVGLGAQFGEVNGCAMVESYGDVAREYRALKESAGLIDLSCRSRLCVLGSDRVKFLHGQVTNDVNRLQVGEGCYAVLVDAKGRIQSDMNVLNLEQEILLDLEPGYETAVKERLERFVIADDVQVVAVSEQYGLLSLQGPRAESALAGAGLGMEVPRGRWRFTSRQDERLGEVYLVNNPRVGSAGVDLFVPMEAIATAAARLLAAVQSVAGCPGGWSALEIVRVEAGIPRCGTDMNETNLAPEAGLDENAISYTKGCYIGQEVISRIRTYGQVAKRLRRLEFPEGISVLPAAGARLTYEGRDVGYVTSVVRNPITGACLGLGYVRREVPETGAVLRIALGDSEIPIVVSGLSPIGN